MEFENGIWKWNLKMENWIFFGILQKKTWRFFQRPVLPGTISGFVGDGATPSFFDNSDINGAGGLATTGCSSAIAGFEDGAESGLEVAGAGFFRAENKSSCPSSSSLSSSKSDDVFGGGTAAFNRAVTGGFLVFGSATIGFTGALLVVPARIFCVLKRSPSSSSSLSSKMVLLCLGRLGTVELLELVCEEVRVRGGEARKTSGVGLGVTEEFFVALLEAAMIGRVANKSCSSSESLLITGAALGMWGGRKGVDGFVDGVLKDNERQIHFSSKIRPKIKFSTTTKFKISHKKRT